MGKLNKRYDKNNKKYDIKRSIKMELIFGEDIRINIGKLKSFRLKDILEMGIDKYNECIGVLSITKDDIDEIFDYELEHPIDPFMFITNNFQYGDDNIRQTIIQAFEMIFEEPVSFCDEGYFFLGDLKEERFIDFDNFYDIVKIVKEQNCVQDVVNRAKPKNEAQKKYFKRLKEVKQKYKKKEESDMPHIISAISAKHYSYNLFNIENLTIYQLIDQYKRLCCIEEYTINFQSLMHGASGDDIKIKHWSEPMD